MNVQNISAHDFLKSHAQNSLHVVDLRTPLECRGEALAGCRELPVQDLNGETFAQLSQDIDANASIYLLCQSGQRATIAVDKLKGKTARQLVIIEGGLNALKSAGANLISSDKKVIGLERQVRIAAGFLVLVGVLLGFSVNTAFFGLSGFVGAGLMFAGITNTCAMGMLIARMPWNQVNAKA
jgi:rhodanese-related sulfurtransferase